MKPIDKFVKVVVEQQKKSRSGSQPPKIVNVKLPEQRVQGRVVRKEQVEKPKYVPRGKVVRKKD
jgi:hypothetical protein